MFFVNIHLITKTILACASIVIAFALIIAPSVVGNDAFAGKKSAFQSIKQYDSKKQSSKIVSDGDIKKSGNNFNIQKQENRGGNSAAQ
jgi:hypothetical protein